jgi:glycosyltransferase involved in cell wall biosynthesis
MDETLNRLRGFGSVSADIWIVIPVHNRREITRRCLENLRANGDLDAFQVCVVDDASSDGTGAMLARDFPQVHIEQGDGNLYWGGGIRRGMQAAHAAGCEVVVWLNDDCLPAAGSIAHLIQRVRETRGICGGVCTDPESGEWTYSGTLSKVGPVVPARGEFRPVDLINGNLVAVHREVMERIGFLDAAAFPHYGGDSVYSLSARQAGLVAEISGTAPALNRRDNVAFWNRFGTTKAAWRVFQEPLRVGSPFYLPGHWQFMRRMYGWGALPRMASSLMKLTVLFLSAVGRARGRIFTLPLR